MPILKIADVEFDLYCECGAKLECEVLPPGRRPGGVFCENQQIEIHRCPDCLKKAQAEAAKIGYITGHDDTVESRYGDPDETADDICRELEE